MIYPKNFLPILAIAVGAGFLASYTGLFVFGLNFFFYPVVVGLSLIAVQQEDTSYKHLPILAVGSLVFSFTVAALMMFWWYFESVQFYVSHTRHLIPFGFNFNALDQVYLGLALAFVSFMAGLVAVVVKGFYLMYKSKSYGNK